MATFSAEKKLSVTQTTQQLISFIPLLARLILCKEKVYNNRRISIRILWLISLADSLQFQLTQIPKPVFFFLQDLYIFSSQKKYRFFKKIRQKPKQKEKTSH